MKYTTKLILAVLMLGALYTIGLMALDYAGHQNPVTQDVDEKIKVILYDDGYLELLSGGDRVRIWYLEEGLHDINYTGPAQAGELTWWSCYHDWPDICTGQPVHSRPHPPTWEFAPDPGEMQLTWPAQKEIGDE